VKLSSGLLDQWYFDEANVMKAITSLATGEEEVSIGLAEKFVTASSYRYSIRDALKAGVTNYALPVHTFDQVARLGHYLGKNASRQVWELTRYTEFQSHASNKPNITKYPSSDHFWQPRILRPVRGLRGPSGT